MARRVQPQDGSFENNSETSGQFNYDYTQYNYDNSYESHYQPNFAGSNIETTSNTEFSTEQFGQFELDTSYYNGKVSQTRFPVIQPTASANNYNYDPNYSKKSFLSAFGSGGFDNEPPLLDELGINFSHIKDKTLASLNPFRKLDSGTLNDADLTGPLIFCFLFGTSLLLTGKIHFGYIYGVATLGWISIFTILNLMTESGVNFYLTGSVLGYCLLPMVLLSAVAVLLKLRGVIGLVLGITSVSWCTFSSSTYFVAAFGMQNQQVLIGYPIFLLYSCFALMTIF